MKEKNYAVKIIRAEDSEIIKKVFIIISSIYRSRTKSTSCNH